MFVPSSIRRAPIRKALVVAGLLNPAGLMCLAGPTFADSDSLPTSIMRVEARGGCSSLTDAILAANQDTTVNGCVGSPGLDIIILDSNLVVDAADEVNSTRQEGAFAAFPDITSPVRIEAGSGQSIERLSSLPCGEDEPTGFRFFNVLPGGALTVQGLTLRAGCWSSAGAIGVSGGSLSAVGSVFVGNGGISTGSDSGGGAIGIRNGNLDVTGCRFENNFVRTVSSGDAAGGAIGAVGLAEISVVDSEFVGNSVQVSQENSAAGGAVAVEDAAIAQFIRVSFRHNSVTASLGAGGALALTSVASGIIQGSELTDNLIQAADGAIVSGLVGGALVVDGSELQSVSGNSFERNRALGRDSEFSPTNVFAGAFFARIATIHTVSQNTFSDNRVVAGSAVTAKAGGDVGQAWGGAAYWDRADGTWSHNTLVGNLAQGGIFGGPAQTAFGGGFYTVSGQVPWIGNLAFDNQVFGNGDLEPSDNDCEQGDMSLSSQGYNLVAATKNCSFQSGGDQTGVKGRLGIPSYSGCAAPLIHGSCPLSLGHLDGSSALDAASCQDSGLTVDARGISRPQDIGAISNTDDGCDIGAFESRDQDGDGSVESSDCNDLDSDPDSCGPIFMDGFESGNSDAWSLAVP